MEIMPTPKPPGGENWYINNQLGHFITRYAQHRGSEENTITLAAFLSGSEFQSLGCKLARRCSDDKRGYQQRRLAEADRRSEDAEQHAHH